MRVLKLLEGQSGLIFVLWTSVILFAAGAVFVQWFMESGDVLLTFLIGLSNQFAGALLLWIKQQIAPTNVESSGSGDVSVTVEQPKKQPSPDKETESGIPPMRSESE